MIVKWEPRAEEIAALYIRVASLGLLYSVNNCVRCPHSESFLGDFQDFYAFFMRHKLFLGMNPIKPILNVCNTQDYISGRREKFINSW